MLSNHPGHPDCIQPLRAECCQFWRWYVREEPKVLLAEQVAQASLEGQFLWHLSPVCGCYPEEWV